MPKKTFMNLSEGKKRAITNGLIKVFDEYGYDKTTVANIVKTCHIPRGSFYQYFEDKYDAFRYLIDVNQKEKMIYLKPYLDKLGTVSFFDLYVDLIDVGLQFAEDRPELVRIWMRFYQTVDRRVDYEWKLFESMAIDALVDLLEQDAKQGCSKKKYDKHMVAKMLFRYQSMEILEAFNRGVEKEVIKEEARKFMHIIRYGVESEACYE